MNEPGLTPDERKFRGFAAKTGLTREGIAYAEIATDPFHDDAVKDLRGYPDMNSMTSVVMCLPQSMTITKPSSLATGPWDCHILMWPMPEQRTYSLGGGSGGAVWDNFFGINTANGTYTLGGVQAYAGLSSAGSVDPFFNVLAGSLGVPPADLTGICRIISAGLEIIDTTAQLYKQGSVYSYLLPNPQKAPQSYFYTNQTAGAVVGTGVASFQDLTRPVTNIADIETLRGTVSWESKEGVYVVQRPCDVTNTAEQPAFVHPIFALADKANRTPYSGGYVMPTPVVVPGTPAYITIDPQVLPSMHTMGCYFSGLSDQAALTVKWRVVIERMPTSGPLQLVATPTPGFDPLVMEVISQVFGQLPVAVPVSENPEGEWFSRVVSAVKDITDYSGLAASVPHPAGKAVAGLGAAINAAASAYLSQHPVDNGPAPVAGSQQQGLPQLGTKKRNPRKKKKQGLANRNQTAADIGVRYVPAGATKKKKKKNKRKNVRKI